MKIESDWENALLRPKPREKKMTISQKIENTRLKQLKLKKGEILPD